MEVTREMVTENLRLGVRPVTGDELSRPVLDGKIEAYLYIHFPNGKGKVTQEVLNALGLSIERAYGIAEGNTREAIEAKSMYETFRDLGFGIPEMPDGMPVMIVATNRERMYGASALLFPCILADILKANGIQKARIAPSSVHEVIITEMLEGDDIDGMVSEINDSTVAPEDRLADHWYFIDQEGKITW